MTSLFFKDSMQRLSYITSNIGLDKFIIAKVAEIYKVLKRTCWAIVLPIRSFVFPFPCCLRRRGLLKVPLSETAELQNTLPSFTCHRIIYCVMPRSPKPPDRCKWGGPKGRYQPFRSVVRQRRNMRLTQSIDCTILRHYLRRCSCCKILFPSR